MASPSATQERPETAGTGSERPGTSGTVVSAVLSRDPREGTSRGSVLGSSLNRTIGERPTSHDSTGPAGSKGRNSAINADVSKHIAERYAAEVKEADNFRKAQYSTIEATASVMPAGLDIARDMRRGINDMLASAPKDTLSTKKLFGWDALFTDNKFKKQMQFLHEHARTGHFCERYGADGCYEGEFLHGMRHGKGKHEFRDEVYDGDWKWDQRHGWGSLRNPDGTVIEGYWQQGKPDGFASVIDAKGLVVYEGEFKAGRRHGLGRQLFESGDMYDGGWQEGRLHDRGVYYFTNGDRLYGMWNKGIYDGVGVFHYADGSISRRVYKDGLLTSVQDYEHATQHFGKTETRDLMHQRVKFPVGRYRAGGLAEGMRVAVSGVQTTSAMNGQEGRVMGYDYEQGCWRVRMDDGSIHLVSDEATAKRELAPKAARLDEGFFLRQTQS